MERGYLVALDFDPAVTAIVSQPFWLHWRTPPGWTYNDPAHRWAHAHYDRFDRIRGEPWGRLLH